jgi:hypothetical protein
MATPYLSAHFLYLSIGSLPSPCGSRHSRIGAEVDFLALRG